MATLTREDIDICNVKNRAEIDFLITESEQAMDRGERMYSFEEFFEHSEKMLANLGKPRL